MHSERKQMLAPRRTLNAKLVIHRDARQSTLRITTPAAVTTGTLKRKLSCMKEGMKERMHS